MSWTKGTPQSAKFQTFDCPCEISPNLYFDRHSKVSKICTLMGSFWRKYIMFELKKSKQVMFHDTEEWCKIWRKTGLWFRKWHGEFSNFLPEHSKVSKLGLWWDPYIHSRKCISLKVTEELCVMTLKNDAKFEEKLTCRSKIDMRNLLNFDQSTRKSQKICTLIGSFWTKYIIFELQKHRRVMFDGTEDWCKIWSKTDLCFPKWDEKFGKFSPAEKWWFHIRE